MAKTKKPTKPSVTSLSPVELENEVKFLTATFEKEVTTSKFLTEYHMKHQLHCTKKLFGHGTKIFPILACYLDNQSLLTINIDSDKLQKAWVMFLRLCVENLNLRNTPAGDSYEKWKDWLNSSVPTVVAA